MINPKKENPKTGLTPFAPPVPRPRLDESQVLNCEFGNYPWDGWHRWALAQGLAPDLASLGRSLIREANQHDWDERLKSLCGWRDNGQRMLQLALRSPATASKRWNRLMETDGNRGYYDSKTGEWVSFR